MRTHGTPPACTLPPAVQGTCAVVIASMRVLGDGVRCDQPLFRLVRVRLTAGSMSEEHLVQVERTGSACLTHNALCQEARRAAELFLVSTGARWEEGDTDDRDEEGV